MTAPLCRRHLLATGAAAAAAPALAACGGGDGSGGSGSGNGPEESGTETAAGGTVLGSAAEIPVGGCAVFPDAGVVVTQPTEGDLRGFGATCTHQGCLLGSSSEGTIPCDCHGSAFSLTDGAPVEGPAEEPLPKVSVTVEDGNVVVA